MNTFLDNVMKPTNFMHTYLISPVACGETLHMAGIGQVTVRETAKAMNTPSGQFDTLRWEDAGGVRYGFPCHFVKCRPVGRDDLDAICVVTRICAHTGGGCFEQSGDFVRLPTSSIRAAVPYLEIDRTGRIFPLVLQ